jgi:DNA repair photolyase
LHGVDEGNLYDSLSKEKKAIRNKLREIDQIKTKWRDLSLILKKRLKSRTPLAVSVTTDKTKLFGHFKTESSSFGDFSDKKLP